MLADTLRPYCKQAKSSPKKIKFASSLTDYKFVNHNFLEVSIMLVNILLWIVLGAVAGWIASMIMGRDAQMGAMANIVVGIVGALIGGFIMNFFGQGGATGFNLWSLIVAILGAVVLLFIIGLFRRA